MARPYTTEEIEKIERMFAEIPERDTVHMQIFDHHFDKGGDHKTNTLRRSKLYCPSCRGVFSATESILDNKYRGLRGMMDYNGWLDRIKDYELEAVLHVKATNKIAAIKMLRTLAERGKDTMPLSVAKAIVERCEIVAHVEYEVIRG